MNAREFLQTDVVLVGSLLYAALGKPLADRVLQVPEREARPDPGWLREPAAHPLRWAV